MLKTILGTVASVGAGQVVNNIITATTPENAKDGVKVLTKIGSFAIGGMVSVAVAEYTGDQIDELTELIKTQKLKRVVKKEA